MATKRKARAVDLRQAPEGGITYEYANPHYVKTEPSDTPAVRSAPHYESFLVSKVFHEQALAAWCRKKEIPATPSSFGVGVRGFAPGKDGGAIVYKFNDELDYLTKEELETEEDEGS